MQVVILENYTLHDPATGSRLQDFNFGLGPGEACLLAADYPDDAHLLARALATLVSPTSGRYIFAGDVLDFGNYRNLLAYKKRIGYFGAAAALVSNLTLEQNLILSRAYFENRLDLDLDDNVMKLCDAFHLTEKLDLRPTALSPLDVRAAILTREMAKPAKLIIMDSPEDLIDHPGFDFLVTVIENRIAAGVPLVLRCENEGLSARLTNRTVRLPLGGLKL